MRKSPLDSFRTHLLASAIAVGALMTAALASEALPTSAAVAPIATEAASVTKDAVVAAAVPVQTLAAAPAAEPTAAAAPLAGPLSTDARIVVVEWKIKKGHEQEFLDYWAKKSTIPDRSGLIAEFLSGQESRDRFPWINWVSASEDEDATTYYNIGIWRRADDFMGQIGKYIDNNRPPMPFEAAHRHRVFLQPLEWRVGMSSLPTQDRDGVK